MQPLDERTRTFAICTGLILVGGGVVLLVKTIQAHVWEGESILGQVLQIYASTFFGLATLSFVIRDYRLVHYGLASRQLTPEQIEPIRQAMEDFDLLAAIRLFRKAVPDAGLPEAREYAL